MAASKKTPAKPAAKAAPAVPTFPMFRPEDPDYVAQVTEDRIAEFKANGWVPQEA